MVLHVILIRLDLSILGRGGDKVCNIYDMANNSKEWCTEVSNEPSYGYCSRGGNAGWAGRRDAESIFSNKSICARIIIFRKN